MPFKVRRRILTTGGLQVGTNGTAASKFQFGLVDIGVPALTASGGVSASDATIANAAIGDYILLVPYNVNSATAGVAVRAASITAATCVSASFASITGSAVEAHQAGFMYFLFG